MSFFNYLYILLNKIKAKFKKEDNLTSDESIDINKEEASKEVKNDTISFDNISFIRNNSLMDNINLIRTKLSRIEIVCPSEFLEFSDRLNKLEQLCNKEYQDYIDCIRNDKLTFNCDPTFNSDLTKKVHSLQLEIDEYISKIAIYRLLQERLEKMFTELSGYYNSYIKGEFKGNFEICIQKAEETLSSVIKRVIEEDKIDNSSIESYFEQKSLNDIYLKIRYTILKCYIRYYIANDRLFDEISHLFKEQYLFYIMKDLEFFRQDIASLESSTKYERLNVEYKKVKSANISDLNIVLNSSFLLDFMHLEDLIIYEKYKKVTFDVKNKTNDLLTKLNS